MDKKISEKLESLALSLNRVLGSATGFKLKRAQLDWDAYRRLLIERFRVNLIVDAGANVGQWAQRILNQNRGMQFELMSFEPGTEAFGQLSKAASGFPNWTAINAALGEDETTRSLNLSSNLSQSASLRRPKEHLSHFETVKFRGAENVTVQRLDQYASQLVEKRIFLKLDVQGFEKEVITGCSGIIDQVQVIEVETSFQEMYEGQASHLDILNLLDSKGFTIRRYSDPALTADGNMTYVDVLASR